jgi:hypothetical protein
MMAYLSNFSAATPSEEGMLETRRVRSFRPHRYHSRGRRPDPDYTKRSEPAKTVEVLRTL